MDPIDESVSPSKITMDICDEVNKSITMDVEESGHVSETTEVPPATTEAQNEEEIDATPETSIPESKEENTDLTANPPVNTSSAVETEETQETIGVPDNNKEQEDIIQGGEETEETQKPVDEIDETQDTTGALATGIPTSELALCVFDGLKPTGDHLPPNLGSGEGGNVGDGEGENVEKPQEVHKENPTPAPKSQTETKEGSRKSPRLKRRLDFNKEQVKPKRKQRKQTKPTRVIIQQKETKKTVKKRKERDPSPHEDIDHTEEVALELYM